MTDDIKILYFHTSLANKGPTKQLLYLVTRLHEVAFVRVLTLFVENEKSLLPLFKNASLNLITPQRRSVSHFIKVLVSLRSGEYDIVHTAGFLPDLLAYFFCPREKWVSVARNSPQDDYPAKFGPVIGRCLAVIQLFLHSKCRRQVACSAAVSRVLKDHGVNSKVIRNAIPLAARSSLKQSLRRPLSYLVLGTVNQRKRVDLAIAVYLQLRRSGDQLMVVGDGPLKAKLSAKYFASRDITFVGHVEHVTQQLEAADILISMSSSEGFPNAVIEALMHGLYCILSNIQPHIEIQRLQKVGVSTISCTDSAMDLRENPEVVALATEVYQLPDDMPVRITERAGQKFSVDKMVNDYIGLYKDIF